MKLTKNEKDIIVVTASMLRSERPLLADPIDELVLEANSDFSALEESEIEKLKKYVVVLREAGRKFNSHKMPCAMVGKIFSVNEVVVVSVEGDDMLCEDQHGWKYNFNLKDSESISGEMPRVGEVAFLKSRLLRVGPGESYHDYVFVKGVRDYVAEKKSWK
jgi:hypothetical protein